MFQIGDYVKYAFVRLRRFKYRRGFGVQSPFAYGMICEVINGKEPYYAFRPLHQAYLAEKKAGKVGPDAMGKDFSACRSRIGRNLWPEKHYRMLFRLINWVHPGRVLIPDSGTSLLRQYLTAACPNTRIATYENFETFTVEIEKEPMCEFVLVPSCSEMPDLSKKAADLMPQDGVLVLEDIHRSPVARRVWENLRKSPPAVLTFDLYTLGIVFFNSQYVKQNYIVNF